MEDDLVPSGFHSLVDRLENALDDLPVLVPGGTSAGQGLQEHPHGTAVRIHNHVPFKAVNHIFRSHLPALMKLHALADDKSIGLSIL